MKTYKWGGVTPLPDGHRLFPRYDSTRDVALADDSGREPQTTTDGVLWLDRMRPLMVGNEHCSIPLRGDNGKQTRTVTNAATVLYLSAMFDWPIVTSDEGIFKALKIV